jgi:hypothetical protein
MRHLIGASLAIVTLFMISTASAQTSSDKIGQVSFPISCSPAVQKPFERGVALLHSFWYLESVKAFKLAPARFAQAKAFPGSK